MIDWSLEGRRLGTGGGRRAAFFSTCGRVPIRGRKMSGGKGPELEKKRKKKRDRGRCRACAPDKRPRNQLEKSIRDDHTK